MLKLSLRALGQHKIRYAAAAFAVLLGVSFVVASFVLADSLRKVFEGIGDDIGDPIAVQVRAVDPFGRDASIANERPPVPAALLDELASVDGVAIASGDIGRFVSLATKPSSGEPEEVTPNGGAPIVGVNWDGPDASVSAFTLVEGESPRGQSVAIDVDTAATYDLGPGSVVTVTGPAGPEDFDVSGTVRFGEEGGGGAIYVVFDTETAGRFLGAADTFDTISFAADEGVSDTQLLNRLTEALPSGYEAVSGEQVGEEFTDSFGQIIGIIRGALLGFAGVALFVSTFIISNTFAIIIGQRTRELAMLRAIGAFPGQVFRAVIIEAALIGLLGSVLGALAGVGVARLLVALITSQGGSFPDVPLVLSVRTWTVAVVVGMGVTLLSSLAPSWRAGRVSPMAAIRESSSIRTSRPTRRLILGAVLVALGMALMAIALFGSPASTVALLSLAGVGAVLIFLGVARLSALFARPVVDILGRRWFAVVVALLGVIVGLGGVATALGGVVSGSPGGIIAGVVGAAALLAMAVALVKTGRAGLGLPGTLGRENAARSPARTAVTASALMIGLALVGVASVLGQSFKDSFVSQLGDTITADYFISTDSFSGMSPALSEQIAALPDVDAVSFFRQGPVQVSGENKTVAAVDPSGIDQVLRYTFVEGGWGGLDDNGLVINQDVARDRNLSVGDQIPITFVLTGEQPFTVTGIFDSAESFGRLGNWIISRDVFRQNFGGQLDVDFFGGASLAQGADSDSVRASIDEVITAYPGVTVEDRVEFKATQESSIDQLLFVINALLVFSLIIALLGIANTMALSVIERTRELGLVRAIGASRHQVRAMVRWESIVVSAFGAILGIVLGVAFGLAIASALPQSVLTEVSVPVGTLVGLLVVGIIAGLLASLWPARRAARLNVLEAISYE